MLHNPELRGHSVLSGPVLALFCCLCLAAFLIPALSARVPAGMFLATVWDCSPVAQAVGSCSCPELGVRLKSFIHSFGHTLA